MASPIATSLGDAVPISLDCVQCCLSWRRHAAITATPPPHRNPDMHLRALLMGPDGDRLGVVSRELKENAANVAAQWEACGVKHVRVEGDTAADITGCEEVALDFSLLDAIGLVEFIILIVSAAKLSAFEELALAELEVRGTANKEQLTSDEKIRVANHAAVFIFCRGSDGRGWSAISTHTPLQSEEVSSELAQDLSLAARKKGSNCLTGIDDFLKLPNVEDLEEDVNDLCAAGNLQEAIKKQEMLIQILLDGSPSPDATNDAMSLLGELQRRAAASSVSSSALPSAGAASSAPRQDLTASNRLLQAEIEPLDTDGYREVRSLGDASAMTVYINRVLSARDWRCDEMDILRLVSKELPASFEQLVEVLQVADRASWAEHPPTESAAIAGYSAATQPQAQPSSLAPSASGSSSGIAKAATGLATAAAAAVGAEACPSCGAVFATLEGSCRGCGLPRGEAGVEPVRGAHGVQAGEPQILDPPGGARSGGSYVKWVADGPIPSDLEIGGRPCAAMEDGYFVTPLSKTGNGPQRVSATFDDDRSVVYSNSFWYWEPGQLLGLKPDRGPLAGGSTISLTTSDMGAVITDVFIGGVLCEHASNGTATSTSVEVVLPAVETERAVAVEVRAPNGNAAVSSKDAFLYYPPEAFCLTGQRILLSDEGRSARRTEGVTGGICLGASPLRRCAEGRYFEVLLTEWMSSLKTMAIGVTTKQNDDDILRGGFVFLEEARDLKRVWLAGYDVKGAQFINDEEISCIPESVWRPARHLRPDAEQTPIRLGVLWSEPMADPFAKPALVIFQDGVERVRLPCGGQMPSRTEDLYAVVDLQGSVKSASIVEGASPPVRCEPGKDTPTSPLR